MKNHEITIKIKLKDCVTSPHELQASFAAEYLSLLKKYNEFIKDVKITNKERKKK